MKKSRLYFKLRLIKRKQFSRWVIGLVLSISFLTASFIAYSKLIENQVNRLIGESIVNIIEQEYNETYNISHDSISIDLLSSQIILTNVVFQNKSIGRDSTLNQDKLLSASAQKIYLDVDGLWRIWLDDFLKIQKLTVLNPDLDIAKFQSNERPVSGQTGDFLKEIRKQLDLFQIELFELKSAHLTFYEQKSEGLEKILIVPDVSMKISDFEWDTDDKISEIKSDDFTLTIKNQNVILPKSEFNVRFGELSYTLENNEIAFSEIAVSTMPSADTKAVRKDEVNLIIPKFSIVGTDINEAYANNSLQIDSVIIAEPTVHWIRNKHYPSQVTRAEKKEKVDNFIYAIASLFQEIVLQNFVLSEADINIEVFDRGHRQHYTSDQVNITVYDLSIDSLNEFSSDYNLSHDGLDIESTNINSTLLNGTHSINTGHVNYSFKDELLYLDSIKIAPLNESPQNKTANINLDIPQITFEGFNHKQLLEGILDVKKLDISNSAVDLESFNVQQANSTTNIFESFDAIFSNNFNESKIDEINIKNLSVNYHDRVGTSIQIDNGNMSLSDIDLTATKSSLQRTNNFDTDFELLTLNLPQENIKLTSRDLTLDIRSGLLAAQYSKLSSPSVDLTFNQIKLRSPDLSVKNNNKLEYIESLSVQDYDLVIRQSSQKDENRQPRLFVESLDLLNGNISFEGDQNKTFQVKANKISGNKLDISETSSAMSTYLIDLSAASYIQENTTFTLDAIKWDSRGHQMTIQNIAAKQADDQQPMATVQSVSANDFDLNSLLSGDKITIDKLQLTAPIYTGSQNFLSADRDSSKTSATLKLPADYKSIAINQIQIDKGRVDSRSDTHSYLVSDINMLAHNILLDSSSKHLNYPDFFLFSESILGSVDTIKLKNEEFQLDLKKLEVLPKNTLKGKGVAFRQYKQDTIQLDLDNFETGGMAFNSFFKDGHIHMDKLMVSKPIVKVILKEKEGDQTATSISILQTDITDADIKITTPTGEQLNLSPVDIILKGLVYDSTVNMENTFIPAKFVNFSSKSMEWTSSSRLDKIKISGLSLNNNQDQLVIENIRFYPLFNQTEYMEKTGYETDWIEGGIKKVSITGMDFNRFIKERAVISKNITLYEPNISVFRDKNLYDSIINDNKNLPATVLRSLSNAVAIDSINIINGTIAYHEIAEKGSVPGVLTFDNFNAQIGNITNMPDKVSVNNVLRLNIQTDVMNEVAFTSDFKFYLDDALDKFEFSGTVAPNNMVIFNPATEGTAFVHIRSGNCKKLKFTAVADNNIGYGTMYFQYNNLKIDLVDKQTNDINKIEESIASFFANTLLIKKRNLPMIRLRKGDIYFERNAQKSIFNYLSKLFMSGVSSSVGFKNYRKEIRQLAVAKK